jgi:hypothetical protein
MWRVYCSDCGEFTLVGCSQLASVVNLAPGVIAVEMQCAHGHRIPVLTGRAAVQESTWKQPS